MRLAVLLTLLLLLTAPANADVLADWIAIADQPADGKPVPPPLQDQTARTAGPTVALAMFEAANMIEPRYESYLGLSAQPRRKGGELAIIAASAAAVHHVLVRLRPERTEALDNALRISIAEVPAGPERDAALAAGRKAAEATLARTMFSGPAVESYRPAGEAGQFTPPVLPIIQAWSLQGQPFFLASLDEVMPPPPPSLNSLRYAADVNEVKRIGGKGQPGATSEARTSAVFLSGFNLDPMIREAYAKMPRLVDRARFWARMRMAQHDANTMIAVAKMRYMAWRPLNAIRNADRDDNPATDRDPKWEPVLPTPNHPEYPCGHCTMSGLMSGLLSPEAKGPVTVTSEAWPMPVSMTFPDWQAFQSAASLARIQGGMHFRFSNEAGQAMGRRIAAIARDRFAPPIR